MNRAAILSDTAPAVVQAGAAGDELVAHRPVCAVRIARARAAARRAHRVGVGLGIAPGLWPGRARAGGLLQVGHDVLRPECGADLGKTVAVEVVDVGCTSVRRAAEVDVAMQRASLGVEHLDPAIGHEHDLGLRIERAGG